MSVVEMVVAVCMINVELGKETKVRRVLSMFEGVRELIPSSESTTSWQ